MLLRQGRICIDYATTLCGLSCGSGGAGGSDGGATATNDCCQTSKSGGCKDASIQACVCDNVNPDCCDSWDASCVEAATDYCGLACSDGGTVGTCVAKCSRCDYVGPIDGCQCLESCSAMSMDCKPSVGSPGKRGVCYEGPNIKTAHNTSFTGDLCSNLAEVKASWKACGFPEVTFQLP